jgi:hypothetical protein
MGVISKMIASGVSKTAKKESSEVAKRSSDLIGRRNEKFMGDVEVVEPKRLSAPSVAAAKEAEKPRSRAGAIAAGAAIASGVAAVSGKDKEEEESSSRSEGKGRSYQSDRPVRDSGRVTSREEADSEPSKPTSFGAAFKEARAAGKDVFTYKGEKYTTKLASETKETSKASSSEKPTGVREGRNENIDEDTRKRAMASVAELNKGGMVFNKGIGASMKPHNVFGTKGKK